ncbi:peptide-methionine (S)-S-oxide reductase MsrA [Planktosalinus lacus]|uniref:Peptide methionine sulfoxide reductase MsrA n=1 Tax=Planktosalinus lacus TaxID=1526573 RepID=A0A8J2VA70_9FLAO|nr:peptide-methionine (S)-S-oxide reductase MsrA [Planktosalinus lacus]GGD92902.1 peptide methionine sulfoxide reductase MsrA [Planktosalinus lacus]
MNKSDTELATFAGGCFWCTEAVFQRLRGVLKVIPGYIGGSIKNPAYREVCSGKTGHAEAIQISYIPSVITFEELLEVFFATHNPTTLNQQGNDKGTQYRSAIFYHSETQKNAAKKMISLLDKSSAFEKPIVTEVSAATPFYKAEDDHLDYYNRNQNQIYCQMVIAPKVQKVTDYFKEKTNSNYED